MNEQCPHAQRASVIEAMSKVGWKLSHETKKALLFKKQGLRIYFNGEDNSHVDLIFDPVIAGSNFDEFHSSSAKLHERFSSNFREFPQKKSPGQPLNYFGVGCKFSDLSAAMTFVQRIDLPVVPA
jgi:hypothetical protein